MSLAADTRDLLVAELRYHLRDRLMLFLMVVVPLALYPGLIWVTGRSISSQAEKREAEVLVVSAPPAFEAALEEDDRLRVVADPYTPGSGEAVAGVALHEDGSAELVFEGSNPRSTRARDRAREVLTRLRLDRQSDAMAAAGVPVAPREVLKVRRVDVAVERERTGDKLGRWVSLVLIFLVVSSGAYTALDVVTGERERGTLETLLTSRVNRLAVLLSKFATVLVFGGVVLVLSLLSAGVSMAVAPNAGDLSLAALRWTDWVLAGVLILPLLVQIAAIQLVGAAYVPNFRTGQALAMPMMLVLAAPAAVAAFPEVSFSALYAVLPVTGVAMALRSVLGGQEAPGLVALAWVASLAWTALTLYGASRLLSREEVLIGPAGASSRRARGVYGPEAVGLYLGALGLLWFLGQLAQARDLVWGLLFTQVVLFAALAVGTVAWLGLPLAPTLSLRAPGARNLALAALAGLCAPGFAYGVAELQGLVVPTPSDLSEAMGQALTGERGLVANLLLIAVLPAVCEELLMRGGVLGLLRTSASARARVLIVALMFGFLHLNVARLGPTAALGAALTVATLRSGSIASSMLIHFLNNGLAVILLMTWSDVEPPSLGPRIAIYVASTLGLGLALAAMRPKEGR